MFTNCTLTKGRYNPTDAIIVCNDFGYDNSDQKYLKHRKIDAKVRYGSYSRWRVSKKKVDNNDLILIVDVKKRIAELFKSSDIISHSELVVSRHSSSTEFEGEERDNLEYEFPRDIKMRFMRLNEIKMRF